MILLYINTKCNIIVIYEYTDGDCNRYSLNLIITPKLNQITKTGK